MEVRTNTADSEYADVDEWFHQQIVTDDHLTGLMSAQKTLDEIRVA